MIVTASLANGTAQVADGPAAASQLIDAVLRIEHISWETTLNVGDEPYYQSKTDGPFPGHQFRVAVRPSLGLGACHYLDNEDPVMPSAVSWSETAQDLDLVFNGSTGAVFPRTAVIPAADVRRALHEWTRTRQRPTFIQWQPYDMY